MTTKICTALRSGAATRAAAAAPDLDDIFRLEAGVFGVLFTVWASLAARICMVTMSNQLHPSHYNTRNIKTVGQRGQGSPCWLRCVPVGCVAARPNTT
jgi:hypothetical protein